MIYIRLKDQWVDAVGGAEAIRVANDSEYGYRGPRGYPT